MVTERIRVRFSGIGSTIIGGGLMHVLRDRFLLNMNMGSQLLMLSTLL